MKTHLLLKQLLFISFLAFSTTLWSQTTVTYNFATPGASNGSTETAIDTNVSFATFQNGSTTAPTISSSQLRLYQTTGAAVTKGGSIMVIPKNGVKITSYVIYGSGTTGPGNYSVDGGTGVAISGPTYTISSINAETSVELYTITNGTGNRIYVNKIDVTYTAAATAPTVTSTAATIVAETVATLNGTVNANGVDTDASFEYGKTVSYGSSVGASPASVTGTTSTDISAALTGLDPNTQYNYRAVGTVSGTATNGDNLTFLTLANIPSALTVNNPQLNSLDVTINATDSNPSNTEYAIKETNSSQFVQADGSLAATPIWQTIATWGTKTVTGLTLNTQYIFGAQARNGDNVETSFGTSTSGTTADSPVLAASDNIKNQLAIYVIDQTIHIKSTDKIASIEIYDMTGKSVTSSKNKNTQNSSLQVNYKGIAVVKLVLENGKIISKKIIIK